MRRFNDLFKKHYNLSPTALRKKMPVDQKQNSNITLTLSYRPPYLFDEMLRFLCGHAISGVEVIKEGEYYRSVHLLDADVQNVYGWFKVGHNMKKNGLSVTISDTLLLVLPQVLSKIRHLFDLDCDPKTIYEKLSIMNTIRPGLCVLGSHVPGCFNAFEMAVRTILGQQITVKAANTFATRIVFAYGTPVQTGIPELTHVFPSPKDILVLDMPIENHFGPLGTSSSQAKVIYKLAQLLEEKEITLDYCANPEAEIKKLMTISGIGNWTAHYIAMRTIGWTDAFFESDVGIKKALAPYSTKDTLQLANKWQPWRSYATINLWNATS